MCLPARIVSMTAIYFAWSGVTSVRYGMKADREEQRGKDATQVLAVLGRSSCSLNTNRPRRGLWGRDFSPSVSPPAEPHTAFKTAGQSLHETHL